jgi:hypothetical protein
MHPHIYEYSTLRNTGRAHESFSSASAHAEGLLYLLSSFISSHKIIQELEDRFSQNLAMENFFGNLSSEFNFNLDQTVLLTSLHEELTLKRKSQTVLLTTLHEDFTLKRKS